jgi:glyoxylase-like metal-dependent hydrolase (beta-lactamase superfamily II)
MRRKRAASSLFVVACTVFMSSLAAQSPTVGKVQQVALDVYFEDVRSSKLKPPTLLFPDMLIFDDGKHRVELHHFGMGHTKGDGVAWLPKERIVFTGDAVVNGPYNFLGDGDTSAWIETLDKVSALGAVTVGPGHGPLGQASVIKDQQTFFRELRRRSGGEHQASCDRASGHSFDARRI